MPATGRMRSVDAARFAMVPRNDVPRSAFDIAHMHKTTFNAAYLIPVYVDEVLPGDSFRLSMTAFARLATPIVPVMDNLVLESHFFFVPNRLVWANWERFMGEQLNPTDTTTFLVPQAEFVDFDLSPGSIGDYFGLTLNGSVNTLAVNALPFRAYNLIWNDWFRDQDLQVPFVVETDDGPDSGAAYALGLRNKRHDYFTSARPWPAKPMNMQSVPGAPGSFPAAPGGTFYHATSSQIGAPVTGIGVPVGASSGSGAGVIQNSGSRDTQNADRFGSDTTVFLMAESGVPGYPDIRVLVNDMRTASMMQVMLERNARGGTRYAELVRSHFGVMSPDARLQRAEYLGGGRSQVTINPVAQTSASGSAGTTTVLGELAAIGTSVAHGHGFSQSFTEHGILIGMISIRSDLTYQQGINRMWLRRTQFDYYWPGLAHLGEQAIFSRELYSDGSASDLTTFGYQERWSEYKYKPSRTSGFFRSTVGTPLDMWHFGQQFVSRPVLNSDFVWDNPPVDRVLQVSTQFGEQFLIDTLFNVRKVTAMPMYSIPGLGSRL